MQKRIFQLVTTIHIFFYRLTRGKIGSQMRGFHVLLLTTIGRKSGKRLTMPLGYFEDNGAYVVTASNAGFDQNPGWFINLKSNPRVTLEIMDRRMEAVAEVPGAEERNQLWERLIELAPGYADYQKSTARQIPMVLLRPQ